MIEEKGNGTGGVHREILKSTTIIGGSSFISIILRIIRVKVLALLLGPSGMGLFGIYGSITDMVGKISSMGIGSSGVRQIAEAASSGDMEKIARTIFTVRRVALFLGMLGAILLVLLSVPITRLTFGNSEYAFEISLLSITLLLGAVSSGQLALIQGLRKIKELAKVTVLSAIFGTIFSIVIIYTWGKQGIVLFLIVESVVTIFASWWYARKIQVARVQVPWAEIPGEAKPLIKLGSAIMSSAFMTAGTMYLLRVLVSRKLGLEAVGLYQAAVTLSSVYVGFIADSMGKDFYPRLTAAAQDDTACNQIVNAQVEIGLILSAPGLLAMLTFAPMIIQIFYSSTFIDAYEILRWQILGVFLQVSSWPMGYILLAKGKGKMFFWTEFLANAVHVILIWTGITYFGLNGTGMAFLGLYVFYWVLIYGCAKHLTGLIWSSANIRNALAVFPALIVVFVGRLYLSDIAYLILAGTITIGIVLYSGKCLLKMANPPGFLPFLLKVKNHL